MSKYLVLIRFVLFILCFLFILFFFSIYTVFLYLFCFFLNLFFYLFILSLLITEHILCLHIQVSLWAFNVRFHIITFVQKNSRCNFLNDPFKTHENTSSLENTDVLKYSLCTEYGSKERKWRNRCMINTSVM